MLCDRSRGNRLRATVRFRGQVRRNRNQSVNTGPAEGSAQKDHIGVTTFVSQCVILKDCVKCERCMFSYWYVFVVYIYIIYKNMRSNFSGRGFAKFFLCQIHLWVQFLIQQGLNSQVRNRGRHRQSGTIEFGFEFNSQVQLVRCYQHRG